jgi:hypothetical protein
MIKRIVFDVLLLLSAIACPWWFTGIFSIVILYYFKTFNEVILFGVIMDILYGGLSATFNWWDYKFTLFFLLLLITSYFIKKRLKFYNK